MVQELTTPSAKAVGHTPLPWRVDPYYSSGHASVVTIYPPDSFSPICRVSVRKGGIEPNTPVNATERDEANAAFIVRAANSHYQLLSALKAAQRRLIHDGCADDQPLVEQISQAIAAAESEAAHG